MLAFCTMSWFAAMFIIFIIFHFYSISAEYIEQTKQRINERGHDIPEEDKSVLEKLLAVDEKVAIMMANEMLMAGIDTVSVVGTVTINGLYKKNTRLQYGKHRGTQGTCRYLCRSHLIGYNLSDYHSNILLSY